MTERTLYNLDAARMRLTWMSLFLRIILHLLSPVILIWCLNTLFGTEIQFALKTWLAAFLLICIAKFTLSSGKRRLPVYSPFGEEFDEDEDENEDENGEEDEEPEGTMTKEETYQRLKAYSEARKEMSQGKDRDKK